ncbi:hypothetical protein [Paenibacillus oryzisoli]|uniref:Uncharacterized protein n=1 Tax=Paenibacillus oryzisoli TaxID=1850517 RepID=A0A198A328_9BACL|nr:hypothetical protein [Paenibacillus oryzisoli]OAS15403.1 hypothetical protein A8708_04425 [Paenibacillus oryzisoli]
MSRKVLLGVQNMADQLIRVSLGIAGVILSDNISFQVGYNVIDVIVMKDKMIERFLKKIGNVLQYAD